MRGAFGFWAGILFHFDARLDCQVAMVARLQPTPSRQSAPHHHKFGNDKSLLGKLEE